MDDEILEPQLKEKTDAIRTQTVWLTSIAWVFVALGFLAALAGLWSLHNKGGGFSLDNLSAYGSYLQGAVASLWSLAGLMFIYAAFLAQKQQLLQQDAELEDQKGQFRLQHQSITRQNFENSFFQLLNVQTKIASEMRQELPRFRGGEWSSDWIEGRGCFNTWFSNWREVCSHTMRQRDKAELDSLAFIVVAYDTFYANHQEDLGHYFRTLYHLIKFVKFSNFEYKEKRRYTSLVRAQLSAYELGLLFYNCLSRYGKGFKPLVEEFGLLEHLDKKLLLAKSHENFYTESAYQ